MADSGDPESVAAAEPEAPASRKREVELKFLIDEKTARRIWARARTLPPAEAPRTTTLRSIYYDTPGRALKRAGITFRLRRQGRRWVQTVKSDAQRDGILSQVTETEVPVRGGRIDLEAIPDEELRALLGRAVLEPVCETIIKRRAREVILEGGTRAEVSTDRGEIRAAGRSAAIEEAEIELIEGDPRGLFDLAKTLLPDGALRFSSLSKAQRGFLLAEEGVIEPPLAPRAAEAPGVEPGFTAERAGRVVLKECLDQIADNMAAVAHLDDAEGPHQLRIGLRRLRSAINLFAPVLGSGELDRLGTEARWLAQEVGRLRDLEVLAETVVGREADAHPGEPGLATLRDRLRADAAAARAVLRARLAGRRVQAFLLDLAKFVEIGDRVEDAGADLSAADLAREALRKRWKKAAARARGFSHLGIEARHELRKELKKLRYGVEFFAPLYGEKAVHPFLKRLKRLQAVFGELNDAALAARLLSGQDGPEVDDLVLVRARGWMLGASAARAELHWADAKSMWKKLEDSRPFWK